MLRLSSPFALSPMAGLTDSAFRRLVKRLGGCGLVVTEMVSSEGLVRGLGRTLEHAGFTDEERPVAVQLFGGDPGRMARAAQQIERTGADIVDVNMGCPVPKVAKGLAGCSLMRDPERAAAIVAAMAGAVSIPVTVKIRSGWNEREVNAPELACRLEGAGAAAIAVHGRTAAQSYSGQADWDLIARVARAVSIPVYGNGDCIEPGDMVRRMKDSGVAGVLVGRGALRNPWVFAQAAALAAGEPPIEVPLADRGRFLLEYIDMLLAEGPGDRPAAGHARWVVNKLRALCAWYTRGLDGGAHLREAVNHAPSIAALQETISQFFFGSGLAASAPTDTVSPD
jgi:tRNA-dihydrouridine synthase B